MTTVVTVVGPRSRALAWVMAECLAGVERLAQTSTSSPGGAPGTSHEVSNQEES